MCRDRDRRLAVHGRPLLLGGLPRADRYVAATGEPVVGDAQARLRIAFTPEASAAAIGELLSDTGAELIGGPGALGFYTVGFKSEAARDAANSKMRATPSVIALVDDAAWSSQRPQEVSPGGTGEIVCARL